MAEPPSAGPEAESEMTYKHLKRADGILSSLDLLLNAETALLFVSSYLLEAAGKLTAGKVEFIALDPDSTLSSSPGPASGQICMPTNLELDQAFATRITPEASRHSPCIIWQRPYRVLLQFKFQVETRYVQVASEHPWHRLLRSRTPYWCHQVISQRLPQGFRSLQMQGHPQRQDLLHRLSAFRLLSSQTPVRQLLFFQVPSFIRVHA